MTTGKEWYAVRCVFREGWLTSDTPGQSIYEERITLWLAGSASEAIERAEAEAEEYARTIDESPSQYLGLAQSSKIETLGDGSEIFSLLRGSALDAETYLDTFFATGSEFIDSAESE